MKTPFLARLVVFVLLTVCLANGEEIKLSALDLSEMTQGYGSPGINTSVAGKVISIGGVAFVNGVGTHAPASLSLELKGASKHFSAQVGVDDEVGDKGSVEFRVLGDGKVLWTSGIMRGQNPPKAVDVDLTGVKTLTLVVDDAKDGEANDHADWANTVITYQHVAPGTASHNVAHIFGDNMVLQRDKPVPIWGWAKPGEVIKVAFANQVKKATADANGNWMVRLDPMPANKTGQNLYIGAAEMITFKNVLVGDVWICSGQSNMEFGLNGAINAQAEVKTANPMIRFIKIPKNCYAGLRNDFIQSPWVTATPASAGNCTAVGFFFARELIKELDVPIGLISSNWSATSIEPWLCREGLASVPELKGFSKLAEDASPDTETGKKRTQEYQINMKTWQILAEKAQADKQALPAAPDLPPGMSGNSGALTHIFNGLIHPLVPFAMRGVIWYQGESNGGDNDIYMHKMQALVGGWRHVWQQGDFPFYWVQIANLGKVDPDKPEMGDGWCKVREAQRKALTIPNTGMAVTIDIGDTKDVHPKNKQDVGKRLAAWALAKDYGKKIECSGPLFQKFAVEGNKIRIGFDHTGSGLMIGEKSGLEPVREASGVKLKWISIAGADKKFYWAEAVVDGKTLVVSSDKVANPVAVRYAFAMNPEGANLYNKEGFPASPFRTDEW